MVGQGIFPLLISAGILLGANGLIGTLIAIRASLEGFPEAAVGLMGTAYFAGFFGGCVMTPRLIVRAGHVRVFAALCALAAIAALAFLLVIDMTAWVVFRVITGFAFSGLSMVVESWLNERAASADRGRVLSLYRIVDLGAVTGSQFLIPLFGAGGFEIFAVAAILFTGALIPISLSRTSSPAPPEITRLRPLWVWRLSPVATAGCITLGLTNGAFRTVGPLYAGTMGLSVDQVALFMSLGIAGGALLQYPFGWLSDRTDRRIILLLATAGAAASSFYLASTDSSVNAVLLGGFLFGSFALPLYSLSAAPCQRSRQGRRVHRPRRRPHPVLRPRRFGRSAGLVADHRAIRRAGLLSVHVEPAQPVHPVRALPHVQARRGARRPPLALRGPAAHLARGFPAVAIAERQRLAAADISA